jgi:long-subunit acyl-CoA synthetase (AMP-forming)
VLREVPARPWAYREQERPAQDATYAVVYTSGTTGRPKASQVVHRCSVHSGMSYQRVLSLGADDVTAVLFPMYYISAMHAHVLPRCSPGPGACWWTARPPQSYVALLREHGRDLGLRRPVVVAAVPARQRVP